MCEPGVSIRVGSQLRVWSTPSRTCSTQAGSTLNLVGLCRAVCAVCQKSYLEHPSLSVGRGAFRAEAGRPHGHGQPPTTPRIPHRARRPRVKRSLHPCKAPTGLRGVRPRTLTCNRALEVQSGRGWSDCTARGDRSRSWGRRIAVCAFSPHLLPRAGLYSCEVRRRDQ